jgi:phosphohistidine phosphatase
MQIVLFRHGPAGRRDASRWSDDALRPLTDRGEERTREAADGLRRMLDEPLTRILTSPYARAFRTAELLGEAFPDARQVVLEALAPGGNPRAIIDALAEFDDDAVVALVGHEPDLGVLAGGLVIGTSHALPLKKAGACVLAVGDALLPGSAELIALLPPRVLRRLARKGARV